MNASVVSILLPYVFFHAANGLLLKLTAVQGLSTEQTLFFRGSGALFCCVIASRWNRASLVPRYPKPQLVRFLLAGLSLFLIAESYHYAHASTVAVLSRLDIPLLLVLGPLAGEATGRNKSVLAMGLVVAQFYFAWAARDVGESLSGYALASLGTLGLSLGYLLMKKTGSRENVHVVAGVAAAALVFYSSVGIALRGGTLATGSLTGILFAIASGCLMYAIYDLTLRLYRRYGVALAEYPTLFAVLLILPVEMALLQIQPTRFYVLNLVTQILVLGVLLLPRSYIPRINVYWNRSHFFERLRHRGANHTILF